MSFILKALKKLEEEKAARLIRPPDLKSGILTANTTPTTASSRRLLIPMALVIAGAGISFFLLAGDKSMGTPAKKPLPQASAPQKNQTAQALTPVPGSPLPDPVAEKKSASGEKAPGEPSKGSQPPAGADTASRNTPPAPVPSGSPPPGIKVNGIALQDDPSQSVAVVNGILARRGMIIQGMRIEEIFSDSVKFSGNGETFDVKISK